MATYKPVDVDKLESDLTSIADAIRLKAGTTETLSFPDDFVSAVEGIQINDSGVPENAGIYYIGKAESVMNCSFESSANGALTE